MQSGPRLKSPRISFHSYIVQPPDKYSRATKHILPPNLHHSLPKAMDFKETSLEIAIEAFISVLDLAPYTAKIKEGLHEDPRFKNFDDSAVRLETAKFEGLTWIADLFIERIFPTRVCVKGDERYEALSQKNWWVN